LTAILSPEARVLGEKISDLDLCGLGQQHARTTLHTIGHILPISISNSRRSQRARSREAEKGTTIEKLSRNAKLNERWHGVCHPDLRAQDLPIASETAERVGRRSTL
jgi:hypothetical protein